MAIKHDMLRYFVEVASLGNLADAAARLGRTPSALSMKIKQLEAELGAPLFASDRKTHLTALGQFVLTEARRDLEQLDRTIAAIRQYAKTPDGYLRITSVPSVASAILPHAIAEFRQHHPNVSLQIRDADSKTILAQLSDQRIDLGIVSSQAIQSTRSLKSEVLCEDRYGFLCPNDHPFAKTRPHWNDVTSVNFINNHLTDMLGHPAITQAAQSSDLMAQNTSSLLSFVRAGLGITVLPELACVDNKSGLSFVIPEGAKLTRKIQVIWRSDKNLPSETEALVKLLLATSEKLKFD